MAYTATIITGGHFRQMMKRAYTLFQQEHENINNLNVFPVPDGDTGTNMLLTLAAVIRAIDEAPEAGIGSISKRAADSAIMGARGNSGVIFSQIFRGIARGLVGKEQATSAEIAKAFQYGVLYAYRAVARPVEGTILTVAKGIAKGTHLAVRENLPFAEILAAAIAAGEESLNKTPDLLPALKAAGVVDAGGYGLIVFLQGCLAGLSDSPQEQPSAAPQPLPASIARQSEPIDITRPYCTEFIVKKFTANMAEVKNILLTLGDSLVVAQGEEILKVHVHTAHPGAVLESAITWGSLHDIKIDNMADQHREHLHLNPQNKAGLAVISAAPGEGLAGIMRKLGAAVVIKGGQTMNPPVEEFVNAVHQGSAERYIILPNNKNIALAAAQAKKLLGDSVAVVPTMNVPQGLAALLAFAADATLDENLTKMNKCLKTIKAGSITIAVRDSVVDGRPVAAGRYIGLVDNKIVVDTADMASAIVGLLTNMLSPDNEIVTIYYGAELTDKQAEDLAEIINRQWPQIAIEVYDGGQPLYQAIVSVE